jgi:Domain of Unknown Function (DUF1080)
MRGIIRTLCIAAMGLMAQGAMAQTDTPFVSLFNGTDLTNWTTKSAATDIKNFATVHDGYIHLESPGGAGWLWLYSEKSYTDFVLKLKFSAPTGKQGNSGVNFRSMWDPNDAGGFLNGPQVDIYTENNWRTGCILDMTKGSQRWFFPDLPNWNIAKSNVTTPAGWTFKYFPEWNDMEIQVKGMNVKTKVNGIAFANFNGEGVLNDALHKGKNVGSSGYLGLQAHAEEKVVIYFKDLQIADLSTTAIRPSAKPAIASSNRGGQTTVYSLNGKRLGASLPSPSGLKTGLYVENDAKGARLHPVIR